MKMIDKAVVVAEIKKRFDEYTSSILKHYDACKEAKAQELGKLLTILNTIEVKEVEEMYEHPTIKIKDDISVISRLQYIDDDLKQIADFILEYASWNLHKDEWNQPVLEVPLFRVLDALIQRGKPYCEC